jgi:phage terminase small subunit
MGAKGDKGLNPRQRVFAREYQKDLNLSQAAIRAGYGSKSAKSQASRLMSTNGDLREMVATEQADRLDRLGITAERIVEELARVAFRDASDVVEWGPDGVNLRDSSTLPAGVRAAIAEVSETNGRGGRSQRVRLHDKLKALELLGKHLPNFFTPETVSPTTNTVNVLVQSPDFVQVRNRIIAALKPYPLARDAVLEALRSEAGDEYRNDATELVAPDGGTVEDSD